MQGNLTFEYPRHMRIEIYRGCNRRCSFCGICTVELPDHAMSPEVFDSAVLRNIEPELKRIDIDGHGEPLLNKHIASYVERLRKRSAKLQITILSNTEMLCRFDDNLLLKMFDSGLNFFHADLYTKKAKHNFIEYLRKHKTDYKSQGIHIVDFYNSRINPWSYQGINSKFIILCSEKNRTSMITRRWNNNGGHTLYSQWAVLNRDLSTLPSTNKCIEPFKCAMVTSEGTLMMCCLDWSKSCIFGDLKIENLRDVWNSVFIQQVRYSLHHGRRDIIPTCKFCDKKSFRVGLYGYSGPQFDFNELAYIFKHRIKKPFQQEKLERIKNELS